jgi:hypothetical protein
MMKKCVILILILFLYLSACRSPVDNSQIVTVDMTSKNSLVQFNLNEYVEDVRMVRLASGDGSLIRYFTGHIGKKYIISVESDKVLLFNSEGEFIRIVAKKGKGPGEYTQLDAWVVDENENFFLYHDIRKNYICNYNLNNQQLDENVSFEDHGYLSQMVLINDTLLSILPSMFSEYGYLFFNQTFSGRVTGGITKENTPHPGTWAGRSPIFKKVTENSIVFQPSESDTVFKIDGAQIAPIFVLLVEKPQKNGDITTGYNASYLHSDKNQLLIAKSGYESMVTPTSSSIRMTGIEYLSVDLKTMNTCILAPFMLEIMDLELEVPYIAFSGKNRFFTTYQAVEFKKIIDKTIKRDDVTGSRKERLMQLNREISEDDNPIIITGTWKQL